VQNLIRLLCTLKDAPAPRIFISREDESTRSIETLGVHCYTQPKYSEAKTGEDIVRVEECQYLRITPPVKFTFCVTVSSLSFHLRQKGKLTAVVTIDLDSNPEVMTTSVPLSMPPTRWPPVTFVKVSFVSKVGRKADELVKADAG
jgi:hypothetical protein